MSSLSRAELGARCQLVRLYFQKFCIMKLLLGRVDFYFKVTTSHVVDEQSTVLLKMSDTADFNLVRICYCEA